MIDILTDMFGGVLLFALVAAIVLGIIYMFFTVVVFPLLATIGAILTWLSPDTEKKTTNEKI